MSLDQAIREKYQLVIGLEVHAQLLTESKLFCSDSSAYGSDPNTNISVISLGHPGTLPKLNKKAVDYAIKMGLACESTISKHIVFARKNYFYPDLPKGFQITQDKTPICIGGKVWIRPKGSQEEKAILLNRIHMEEDAGKSIHTEDSTDTLVDFNRAGVPLIEIVTEPELRSADEAYAFLTEVRRLVRYLQICDGNMEEGSLRCDANISVNLKDDPEYGNKVEVKNMNSIRNVHRAIEYEAERLIALSEKGERIISETRDFDAVSGTTSSLRTKEELNDYRYFPEPDLSPLIINNTWIEEIKADMPVLAREFYKIFTEQYLLPDYDAQVLVDRQDIALYFQELCQYTTYFKAASNWVMGTVKSYLNENSIEINDFPISAFRLAELIELVETGKLSNSIASQKLFPKMLVDDKVRAETLARESNLLQDSSSENIQPLIDQVLEDLADKVEEYKAGRKGLIGLFVGEVMKRSKGKADPKKTNELIQQTLK